MHLPMPLDDIRRFRDSCRWVETRCGGELHEFSLRVLCGDDKTFVRFVETIREYGYDGRYLGKAYRYLDVDGLQYFTQGYDMRVTELINRKKSPRAAVKWEQNPVRFVSLPDSFGRLD